MSVKQKVYLDDYVIEYLQQFGPLNSVVNKCVDMAMHDTNLWLHGEIAPHRGKGMRQVFVTINNPSYEEYRAALGATSTNCSIRRLLYHVFNNELLYDAEVSNETDGEDVALRVEIQNIWSRLVRVVKTAKNLQYEYTDILLEAACLLESCV